MSPEPSTSSTHYNRIYVDLVKEPSDLIGMIAYAHYKQQKFECIKQHWDTNSSSPSDDDLKKFHQMANTPSSLANYRRLAEDLLESYTEHLREEITEEVVKLVSDEYQGKVEEIAKKWSDIV